MKIIQLKTKINQDEGEMQSWKIFMEIQMTRKESLFLVLKTTFLFIMPQRDIFFLVLIE